MRRSYVLFSLIFSFCLISHTLLSTENNDTTIYKKVDVYPEFKGGDEAVKKFFLDSIFIPRDIIGYRNEMVKIFFVVEKDGSITNVKTRSTFSRLASEVGYFMPKMPKWKPAIKNGQAKRCKLSYSLKFSEKEIKDLIEKNNLYVRISKEPVFPGGDEACRKFIGENLVLPDSIETANAIEEVIISFIVENDGQITDIKPLPESFEQLNKPMIKVFEKMPNWEPARMGNEVRRYRHTYSITISTGIKIRDEVFQVVDEMPRFPGGDIELQRYLNRTIAYPIEARKKGCQGRVYVTFVIEVDGSITDIRVLKGACKSLNEEAIRVVRKMPKWIAGKFKGKPVRVQFNLPIRFVMM